MKNSYLWIFWSALTLSVITAVTLLLIITDLSLFRDNPLVYILSAGAATAALSVLMHNHNNLPLLRSLRLQGRLLTAPLMLLVLSVPAALIYINYDLNGRETLRLLSSLFTSLAAVFFFASLYTFTMMSRATIFRLFDDDSNPGRRRSSIMVISPAAVVAVFIILLTVKILIGFNASGMVLLLPLFALLQVIFDIILSVDFRNAISQKLSQKPADIISSADDRPILKQVKGFQSVLLFPEHYLDLICGRLDYLNNRADDSYASEIVSVAGHTFDPALISSLRTIASGTRFSEAVRHEATVTASNIEKYYTDPARNADLLRRPGISENTATARTLLVSRRTPQESEVIRLMSNPDPEIRRVGLAVAGRFNLKELRGEVLQALTNAETEKEAYYLLVNFGPDSYCDIIGSLLKQKHNERISLMLMRLINMMPPEAAMPYLNNFLSGGPGSVRLAAAKYLNRQGSSPEARHIKRIEETLNETIYNAGRLIALKNEALSSRYFLLSAALGWEISINTELIYCLLSLMTGPVAAEMIRSHASSGTAYGAGIAAEVINTVIEGPLRRPVKALFGNYTDYSRLNELTSCYPIREVKEGSLAAIILSSEQNITGTWTKACALHKIAVEGRGIGKDLALSYLFSNTIILQEEAAGVIRSVNPGWFTEAQSRLPEQVRGKVIGVINGSVPEVSLTFEKTRFLSLSFNNIPEERMIMLASGMKYSESYNSDLHLGFLSWIVPSFDGKSGVYLLSVNDLKTFIFHHPEYTDIFVNYIDNIRS